MTSLLKKLIDWLNNIVDLRLTGIFALIYVYDNQEDTNSPQSIYLEFNNDHGGCIKCASDGESIDCDFKFPTEVDLGIYGNEILKDISTTIPWCEVIGDNLNTCYLLLVDSDFCLGVRLLFQSGKSIDIVNLGDELYVYDSLPESIIQEENIVIKKIDKNGFD
jgi:hypothetical protein